MRLLSVVIGAVLLCPVVALGAESDSTQADGTLPPYLRDRGAGVPTSMFGIYALPKQLIVYPFFEYYKDANAEYSPQELGYTLDQDFRGEYEASEYLILLGYGLSDRVSLEFEVAAISAELEKSPADTTALPQELTESGLGDVQAQVNWMWQKETAHHPAFFSYAEVVFPTQKDYSLIGTSDWESLVGIGAIRGFSWGTISLLASVEYEAAENAFGLGEAAVQYLKRLSPTWSLFGSVEGKQDEWELITEAQFRFSRRAALILNSAVGLTSKAAGWAPEVGILFTF